MSKGLKRICMNCGVRFYDLDKNPIICPSCDTEFTGEIKVKTRRGRVAALEDEAPVKEVKKEVKKEVVAATEDNDDVDDIDADDDIVSLNDIDEDSDDDDDDDDDAKETLTIDSDLDDLEDNLDDLEDNLDDLDDDADEEEDKKT